MPAWPNPLEISNVRPNSTKSDFSLAVSSLYLCLSDASQTCKMIFLQYSVVFCSVSLFTTNLKTQNGKLLKFWGCYVFTARRTVCIARTMSSQDVCLSVTCRHSVETAKCILKYFSPSGRHIILVFLYFPNVTAILWLPSPLTDASNVR